MGLILGSKAAGKQSRGVGLQGDKLLVKNRGLPSKAWFSKEHPEANASEQRL